MVPIVPPGTSSAPTSVVSTVRAQQHSKPPQPLLTVLPIVIATGRYGIVWPSISIVSPTQAWSMNSFAMRRIVAAGTSQMRLRPLRRVRLHVLDQPREGGAALQQAVGQHVVVGADLDRIDLVAALERLLQPRAVVHAGASRSPASHTSGLRLARSRR